MSFIIDDLIDKALRSCAAPDGEPAYTPENMIDIFNEEIINTIIPFIASLQQEYFVSYSDTSILTTQEEYEIPLKAFGNALYELKMIKGNTVDNLPQISSNDYENYSRGFYLKNNKVVIINPNNYSGYTIRFFFIARPNTLTLSTNCQQITKITGNIADVADASSWGSAARLDIIKQTPNFDTLLSNDAATIATNQITFSSLSGVSVGDWVCSTGETPIPQIPQDFFTMLYQAAAIRVFEMLGDNAGAEAMKSRLESTARSIAKVISNRVTNEPKTSYQLNSFFD